MNIDNEFLIDIHIQACQDALISFYGQEQKDFTLPSDADRVDKYVASPLGNTQAIV